MIWEWMGIFPHLVLAGGGVIVYCTGAFLRPKSQGVLFTVALIAAALSGIAVVGSSVSGVEPSGMVDAGSYSRFFVILISVITFLTILFSHKYSATRGFAGDELYGTILFAALGMMLVAGAAHWLTFFLGLELLSISLYILIAAPKGEAPSNEAALKYFIMGSVASGFLTFGIAMLYALTGNMDIAQSLGAGAFGASGKGLLLGFGLILVGVGFKISLVPFHLWTPDVYQGAPAPITAFLSTGSKVALFSALLRFSLDASNALWGHVVPVLWLLAALTMSVGNISALTQTHLKRLLAYSSIAQMGYLLMALPAAKQSGASAVMFYVAAYALMDLGAFGTVAALSSEKSDRDALDEYKGIGYATPWQSALLALCLLSLAGLPPTAGFIGKFLLFKAALQAGYLFLAIIGILTAIISIYYYLKVLVLLYMQEPGSRIALQGKASPGALAGGAILFLILWLGIVPSSLIGIINRVLASFAIPV